MSVSVWQFDVFHVEFLSSPLRVSAATLNRLLQLGLICGLLFGCDFPRPVTSHDLNESASPGHMTGPKTSLPSPADAEQFEPILRDKFFGYADLAGHVVITPQFTRASPFSDDLAVVAVGGSTSPYPTSNDVISGGPDSRVGYIAANGKFSINPIYRCGTPMFSGFAGVALDFVQDANRQQTAEEMVNEALGVASNFAQYTNSGRSCSRWVIIDKQGVRRSSREFKWLRQSGVSGVFQAAVIQKVSTPQKTVMDCKSPYARRLGECVRQIVASRSPESIAYGFIDATGAWILGSPFDRISAFGDGVAWVTTGCKLKLISTTGVVLATPAIDPCHVNLEVFSEGFAAVSAPTSNGELRGYVRKNGAFAIAPQFDDAAPFSEGLAAVRLGKRWGYIDTSGRLVGAPINFKAWTFKNGTAPICNGDGHYAFVDKAMHVRLATQLPCNSLAQSTDRFADFQLRNQFIAVVDDLPSATIVGFLSSGREIYRYSSVQEASVDSPSDRGGTTGTAFVVSKEGYLLTNAHVADSCKTLRLPQLGIDAALVKIDKTNDLALLRVDRAFAVNAPFAREDDTRVGAEVFVFGYPLDTIISSRGNFTTGVISALTGIDDDSRYLQLTAPIQPGNSGGPALNHYGEIVGIVTLTLNAVETLRVSGAVPQNVNFAIGPGTMRSFLRAQNVDFDESRSWFPRKLDSDALARLAEQISTPVLCER